MTIINPDPTPSSPPTPLNKKPIAQPAKIQKNEGDTDTLTKAPSPDKMSTRIPKSIDEYDPNNPDLSKASPALLKKAPTKNINSMPVSGESQSSWLLASPLVVIASVYGDIQLNAKDKMKLESNLETMMRISAQELSKVEQELIKKSSETEARGQLNSGISHFLKAGSSACSALGTQIALSKAKKTADNTIVRDRTTYDKNGLRTDTTRNMEIPLKEAIANQKTENEYFKGKLNATSPPAAISSATVPPQPQSTLSAIDKKKFEDLLETGNKNLADLKDHHSRTEDRTMNQYQGLLARINESVTGSISAGEQLAHSLTSIEKGKLDAEKQRVSSQQRSSDRIAESASASFKESKRDISESNSTLLQMLDKERSIKSTAMGA